MAFQIGFLCNLNHKITLFYLLSFVFIRFMNRCHLLLLIVIFVTRCHSLSFVVTCYTPRCHSLYHSLSFVVPLDTTRCTTPCHSLYHSLPFVITRCHSMSLDVPLVCLFTNDHHFIIFCFLHHL